MTNWKIHFTTIVMVILFCTGIGSSGGGYDPGLSEGWYEPEDQSLGEWDLTFLVDEDYPVFARATDYEMAVDPETGKNVIFSRFRELNINERTKFLAHRKDALSAYVNQLLDKHVEVEPGSLYFGGVKIMEWPVGSRPTDRTLARAKAAHVQKMLYFYDINLFKSAKVIVRRDQYGMQIGAFLSVNWIRLGIQKSIGKVIFKSDPDRDLSGLTLGVLLKTVYDKSTKKIYVDLSTQLYRGEKLILMPSAFEVAAYPVVGVNSGHDQFEFLEPSLKIGEGPLLKIFGEGPVLKFYGGSNIETNTDLMISSIYIGQYGDHQITHSVSPPIPFLAFPPFITGLNTYRSRRSFTAGTNMSFPASRGLQNFMERTFDRERWLTAFQGFAGNNYFEIDLKQGLKTLRQKTLACTKALGLRKKE